MALARSGKRPVLGLGGQERCSRAIRCGCLLFGASVLFGSSSQGPSTRFRTFQVREGKDSKGHGREFDRCRTNFRKGCGSPPFVWIIGTSNERPSVRSQFASMPAGLLARNRGLRCRPPCFAHFAQFISSISPGRQSGFFPLAVFAVIFRPALVRLRRLCLLLSLGGGAIPTPHAQAPQAAVQAQHVAQRLWWRVSAVAQHCA